MGARAGWSYNFTVDYMRTAWGQKMLPSIKAGNFPIGLDWTDQALAYSIQLLPVVAAGYGKSVVRFMQDMGPPFSHDEIIIALYPKVDDNGGHHNVQYFTGTTLNLDTEWGYVFKPPPPTDAEKARAVLKDIRSGLSEITGAVGDGIRNIVGGATKAVGEGINDAGKGVGDALSGLGKGVGNAAAGVGSGLGSAATSLAVPLAVGAGLFLLVSKRL